MSMSKRRTQRQQELWINTADLVTPAGHPFYQRLNSLLEQHRFDLFVEARCESFYATALGRPSIPPGVYFRMLTDRVLRGHRFRTRHCLAVFRFAGIACVPRLRSASEDAGPFQSFGHSRADRCRDPSRSLSMGPESPGEERLAQEQDHRCRRTILEANAALRSIVRRDTDPPL